MRSLSASELLGVWERGLGQQPVQQALILLAAACPETPLDTLAKLSIGQRDSYLLTLREWTFGSELVSLATCPSCSERLELAFSVADIQVTPEAEPSETLSLSLTDYKLRFRLPNSLDVVAIANYKNVAACRHLLLERCLLHASHNGEEKSVDQIPPAVLDVIVEQMAQADPQADVQLALSCAACSHEWQATFDIVSFFWSEIHDWAYRILHEVHTLASAYGWHEADILAMNPWKRQIYLEMVSR